MAAVRPLTRKLTLAIEPPSGTGVQTAAAGMLLETAKTAPFVGHVSVHVWPWALGGIHNPSTAQRHDHRIEERILERGLFDFMIAIREYCLQ